MNAPCYRCARRAINCHTACIPSPEDQKAMKAAGYKIKDKRT